MVRPVTPSVPTTFKLPAELNVEVAEPPKYAVPKTESRVEDACPRVVRPLTVKLDADVWAGLNVPVTVRAPTTVEDACETKPLEPKVDRPLTLKVPTVAVFPLRVVEVAVPKVPTPATVSVPMLAVLELTVVDVAVVM